MTDGDGFTTREGIRNAGFQHTASTADLIEGDDVEVDLTTDRSQDAISTPGSSAYVQNQLSTRVFAYVPFVFACRG